MDAVASIYNNSKLFLKISMVYLPWVTIVICTWIRRAFPRRAQ